MNQPRGQSFLQRPVANLWPFVANVAKAAGRLRQSSELSSHQ